MTALATQGAIESGVRQTERRGGRRIRTVYCIGRVVSGADSGLCHVHNISDGGVQIETGLDLAVGDTVKIGLSDADWFRGRVAWRSGTACGIRFLAPIDCSQLLHKLANDRWAGWGRPPRLGLHRGAVLDTGAAAFPATVRDISQKGMRIRHGSDLASGARITVRLDGGVAAEGVVRWTQDGSSGIELARSFTVEELASTKRF